MNLDFLGTNLNSSNDFCKQYYKILSNDFPDFLKDYINTPPMQRLACTSISCGCNYTNLFDIKFLCSNLDHSIGVALIIWNFTKDMRQTLAGLFHDIATPVFKHCIDFMNGDHENQESTEDKTYEIISNSTEIMELLKRDGISIDEVVDYKLYPIADNSSPALSADRLDYTLTNGVFWKDVWSLSQIKEIYDDLIVAKDEHETAELAFKTVEIAEFFVVKASTLWPSWIDNRDKLTMQFIADTMLNMYRENHIDLEDMYTMSEWDMVAKIRECGDPIIETNFKNFMASTGVFDCDSAMENKYCKAIKTKTRYINPLVITADGTKRIYDVSRVAKTAIDEFLNIKFSDYACIDMPFIPFKH